MSTQLHTEITIEAPPRRVWEVLTDFAAYPAWNPFMPRISGSLEPGAGLDVQLQPPAGRGMRIRPTLLAATPFRELRWLGHLGIPGLFDGEHRFRIEDLGDDRVKFVQEERFSGLLASFLLRFIGSSTRQGFQAMNQALKTRSEQSTPAR
jgi:hypothetical protein